MKERHWSYLAGLIDGEGTIQINKTKNSFALRVKIGNTDIRIMKYLITYFGGVYYTETASSPKHRILYQWRTKGMKNTENLLLGLIPYLIIKGEQAKIALRYIRATSAEERQMCCDLIKPFNQRGVPVTTNTPDCPENGQMIESDLMGDHEREVPVTASFDYQTIPQEILDCLPTKEHINDWIKSWYPIE